MNRKILLQGTFGGLLFVLVVGAGAMHFATQNTETFSVDKEAVFWEVMEETYPNLDEQYLVSFNSQVGRIQEEMEIVTRQSVDLSLGKVAIVGEDIEIEKEVQNE